MKWSTVRDTEKDSGRVRVIRRSSQRDKAETCGETRMEEILRVRVQKEGSIKCIIILYLCNKLPLNLVT